MNKRVYNQQVTWNVLLKNKRMCCVCHSPDRTVQVHHIDGNSANTVENNLAVLCLSHHDQATAGLVKGNVGLGAKLSPTEVGMHKSNWEKAVVNELTPQQRIAIEAQIPRFEIHKAFEKAYTEHANELGQPKGEAEPLKHAYLAQYDKTQVIWNENASQLYRLHMKSNVWVSAPDFLDDDATWYDDKKNSERFGAPEGKLPPWGGPARLRVTNRKDWEIGWRRWHFYHVDGATFVQQFEKGLIIGPFRLTPSNKDAAQVYALTGDGTDNPKWYTSVSLGVPDLVCVEPMDLVASDATPERLSLPLSNAAAPEKSGQVVDKRFRRLSADQKQRLVESLKKVEFPPPIRLRYRNYDMEAVKFVDDFLDVFKEAGWNRIHKEYEYADRDIRQGLFVETLWNHLPPSGALTLANALKEIGLTVTLQTTRAGPLREEDVAVTVGGIEN